MNNLIERLKALATEFPTGFTVRVPNLEPVVSGWVVANKETQNCFGDEGLMKVLKVAEETTHIVGGWDEQGRFYWDAVFVFESESEATKAGIENEQIAIFHLDEARVKYL